MPELDQPGGGTGNFASKASLTTDGNTSVAGADDHSSPAETCRERLLSAATGLFAHRGYEATTVRQIVSAAKVTAPVLYYHFESKEGLLLAVVQVTYRRIHGIADAAIRRQDSVRQSLRSLADGLCGFARESPEMGRLFGLVQLGAFATAPPALVAPYAERFQQRVGAMVGAGSSEASSGRAPRKR